MPPDGTTWQSFLKISEPKRSLWYVLERELCFRFLIYNNTSFTATRVSYRTGNLS
jgi:hypothetical protein